MNGPASLAPNHAAILAARAVSADIVAARGYRSVNEPQTLRRLGFSPKQASVTPGLLIPRWSLAGRPATYPQFRPDVPRRVGDHVAKYELPAGSYTTLDVLPVAIPALRDGADCWVSCEGHIKSDAMLSAGVPAAVAIVGVWAWKTQWTVPAWQALVDACPRRWFHVVADSDFATTTDVARAVSRLALHLADIDARVRVLHPPAADGGKVGVDDYLGAGGSLDDLVVVDQADLEGHAARRGGVRAYPGQGSPAMAKPRIRFISGREGL